MKKSILSIISAVIILIGLGVFASAAEISLWAPLEDEIMPTRDFYVVGKIDREGESGLNTPLNIRIELVDAKGDVVRLLESNVAPDGLTPGTFFLTDYEYGTSYNDSKNIYINKFTPPEIIFDGTDRDSVRLAYNKIVVKDDYFAAIIYGGASKETELRYEDKYEKALEDITEGTYELVITAIDIEGEEVCRYQQNLTFGDSKGRLVSVDNITEYANANSLVSLNSVVGYWRPSDYLEECENDFYYIFPGRFLFNTNIELKNSKNVDILLNNLDTSDYKMNMMLGSIFSKDSISEPSYLYYDIGEKAVNFTFAGSDLKKDSEIIKSKYNKFVEICRVENRDSSGKSAFDFTVKDGVVLAEDDEAVFYGVYSPVISSVTYSSNLYKITNNVAGIRVVFKNNEDEILYDKTENVGIAEENSNFISKFEFALSVTPDKKMAKEENLTLKFYAVDKNNEELFSSEDINVTVINNGSFITGYDENYWGTTFCDTVNIFGEAPSGVSENPDAPITRGNFAAMVNRLLGYSVGGTSKFTDLSKDSIFYNDCITAYNIGYMTGDEKGKINADDLISREQAMIILARISGAEKSEKEIVFKDSELISFWAKDYVDAMCSTGIVSGFDGYINPHKNITVAEAAALIIKTIKWMYTEEEVLPVGDGNNFVAYDSVIDISKIELKDVEFIDKLTEDNITAFFNQNSDAFKAVADYIKRNHSTGAYVRKVGNGLEIRDYKTGAILTFADDAVDIITAMSSYFVSVTIKFNPATSEDIYFSCGKDENNKDIGIAYSDNGDATGKTFKHILGKWYFYIQK